MIRDYYLNAKIIIEKAVQSDADCLTKIAFTAKKHWNYPEGYYRIWEDELTITPDYIQNSLLIYKALLGNVIVGFYSVVYNPEDFYSVDVPVKKGYWLEHMFILPNHHHKGIGRQFIDHAKHEALKNNICCLNIFVDPYAKGFYDKMGARFMYSSPSSIANRLIPVYRLDIEC